MMTPLRAAAPLTPLMPPGQAEEVVRAVAEQSLQLRRSVDQWQPGSVCTEDGRVFSVLTLPRFDPLLEQTPPDVYLDPGSAETRFTGQAHLIAAQFRIQGLNALTSTHSWQPVTVDADGYEVEAYAQFLGFSRAVPLTVHWLPQSAQWLCIGGKITPPRGPEVTVATAKIELSAGFLGLLYSLPGGEWQDSVNYTAAEWVAVAPTGSSASTMGAVDNDLIRARGKFFVPFYAVTTEPVRRLLVLPDFPRLAPAGPGLFMPRLIPAYQTGTLLNT